MIQSIKQFLSIISIKLNQFLSVLCQILLTFLAKILGERRYTWLLGYVTLGQIFADVQWRRVVAYYDAHVDKDSAYYKPIVRIWKTTGKVVLIGFIYLFVIETNIFWLTGEMPSVDDLQNPKLSQASEIYSADGVLLGKYFAENRTPIRDYHLLSPFLVYFPLFRS
jgi:penicillin-binding protein 1A